VPVKGKQARIVLQNSPLGGVAIRDDFHFAGEQRRVIVEFPVVHPSRKRAAARYLQVRRWWAEKILRHILRHSRKIATSVGD